MQTLVKERFFRDRGAVSTLQQQADTLQSGLSRVNYWLMKGFNNYRCFAPVFPRGTCDPA